MSACRDCPRACGIDRKDRVGYCRAAQDFLISRAALHAWEEPCISHKNGAGTVFFAGCNLSCVYCQNSAISRGEHGVAVSPERLLEIFFELKAKGAENIELVTPTHYTRALVPVLKKAKEEGLGLPIVWNSSAYESPSVLEKLAGLVDIYLPDFKYIEEETARRYSNAADYPKVALSAIDEMVRQCPSAEFTEDGKMTRGVIIRHLLLPSHTGESKRALRALFERYGNRVYYSIMRQYTPPAGISEKFPELARPISDSAYERVCDYALDIGIENGFLQEGASVGESFIPPFDLTGVLKTKE